MSKSIARVVPVITVLAVGLSQYARVADAAPPSEMLREALARFHGKARTAVIAEVPQLPLRGSASLPSDTVAAIRKLSGEFHLYAVRRPNSVVFQRRYVTASEMPDLELAELVAAAGDIWRLISPHTMGIDGHTETLRQNQFFAKLTADQIQSMRSARGLPLAGFDRSQQELWSEVNRTHVFGGEVRMSGRAYSILSGWKSDHFGYWTARYHVRDEMRTDKPLLVLRFTPPGGHDGEGISAYRESSQDPASKRLADLAPVLPAGEMLPVGPLFSQAFSGRVEGADGETTLDALVHRIEEATGRRIVIPTYARQRRLLAYVSGARAADVFQGLADLYGWEIGASSEAYTLGRPRRTLARSYGDLADALKILAPVPMRHLWSEEAQAVLHDRRGSDAFPAAVRVDRQVAAIRAALLAEKGHDWQSVAVASLSDNTQRKIANLEFARYMLSSIVANPEDVGYLAEQHKGFFRLDGKDPRPMLTFHVPVNGPRNIWGWQVGTAHRLR